MALHRIRKGLDIPIAGAPRQKSTPGPDVSHVALVADDFHGLKPRLRVEVGQDVSRGDLLLEDAALSGVGHTAWGAGRVVAINRGERRALQSIVIELSDAERRGAAPPEELRLFLRPPNADPSSWSRTEVRDLLLESGMWTALRTRPFSRVPTSDAVPAAVFVTAMDTNPLAADPDVVIADARTDFDRGLRAVAKLSDGATYVCLRAGSPLAEELDAPVRVEEFAGPHPAGTAGVHVHLLEPVGRTRTVWTIGYQDVIGIGRLAERGYLDVERIVAIGGPPVPDPQLLRTRVGASIRDLLPRAFQAQGVRTISGSVLSGKAAQGDVYGYLGRYDTQLSVLDEGGERELLAWLRPGVSRFSALPAFLSRFLTRPALDFSTDAHGSLRAIIPLGLYERVMPMDVLPTFLLRALAADDVERAEELGCLELDEEDLALCSFVDPGKSDFGPMLRRNLELIQEAG